MKKVLMVAVVLLFFGSFSLARGGTPVSEENLFGSSFWDYQKNGFLLDTAGLAQGIRDIEKAQSLQKTGRFLTYGGGFLSIMGATFLIGAKDFGGACCVDKYNTLGYIFLGAGAALVVGGYFMIRKGKKLEGGLAFQMNPHEMKASIGFRLIF